MKKYFIKNKVAYTVLALVLVTLVTSCKKYLDLYPLSTNTKEDVFATVEQAEQALNGVYGSFKGDQGYGIRLSIYYTVDNDEMVMNSATPDSKQGDIGHYNANAGNTELQKPFDQLYLGIENANVAIKYIPAMKQFNNTDNMEELTKVRSLYGEALTLRALLYLELIRNWGDVPLKLVPLQDLPSLSIPNGDRFATYDTLLNDMLVAEQYVPWKSESGATPNTITKGAVKGLRARLALYRAGWALNMQGEMVRKDDYARFYDTARKECLEVINRGDYSLNPSFEAFFKNGLCAHAYDINESIFEIEMVINGGGVSDSKLGYANGPQTSSSTRFGNGYLRVLPNYFYAFDSADQRRDVTIAPFYTGPDNATANDIVAVDVINNMYDGKFRRNWITNPGFTATNYNGVNWPILRYSDVLLMYAEAENELAGPANAYEKINTVRVRAGAKPYNDLSKEDFFKALIKERSLEFGGEGIRKYDLIRWNKLEETVVNTKALLANMASAIQGSFDPENYPAPFTNGAKTMYVKTVNGKLQYFNSFYQPTPSTSTVPGDYANPALSISEGGSKVSWLSAVYSSSAVSADNPNGVNGTFFRFASGFKANKSQLLPYAQATLGLNPNLKQNFGY